MLDIVEDEKEERMSHFYSPVPVGILCDIS